MANVKNIALGPRGIWSKTGLIMLEAGESRDIDLADEDHAADFEIDGASAAEPGPLDLSIEKLTDHLETVNDPAEIDRLIAAETGGKSRQGALAALEARKEALAAA